QPTTQLTIPTFHTPPLPPTHITQPLPPIQQIFQPPNPKPQPVITQIQPLSKLIDQPLTPQPILNQILPQANLQILNSTSPQFQSNSTHQKFLNPIKPLRHPQIHTIIKHHHPAEPLSHFSPNKYHYTQTQLQHLLQTIKYLNKS
ncbi:Hsp33 family molecular chaperone HslO, partial [Staphylococcus epidermidis]|uniref:Hsp33 family molecular chaperone HslO n=1 Tax=Staphylococcus epidermidis TaxID=1282 RepID=UPI0037D9F989